MEENKKVANSLATENKEKYNLDMYDEEIRKDIEMDIYIDEMAIKYEKDIKNRKYPPPDTSNHNRRTTEIF